MQEYSFLHRSLGLNPDKSPARNAAFVENLKNLKPAESGAVSPEEVIYPIGCDGPTMDWPFPQLVRSEKVTLELGASSIHTVNDTAWTKTAVTVYDSANTANTLALTRDSLWHWAMFQDLYFLTNGTNLIWKIPSNASDKVLGTASLPCNSLCAVGNRLALGGLGGSWFSGSRWATVLGWWRASQPQDVFSHEDLALDTSWIVWGERGGGDADIPFLALLTALGVFGNTAFDKMEELILDLVDRGQIGMAPTRASGEIKVVKALGDSVIAYGANGISKLTPQENRYIEQPLLPVGIPGRGCVGGTDNEHVFVDNSENVHRISGEGIKTLGYQNYVKGIEVFLRTFGTFGTDDGEFIGPLYVAVDGQAVWVSDTANNRVQKFDRLGNYVSSITSGLSGPTAIAVYEGELYVCDNGNSRVRVYSTGDGSYQRGWGSVGTGNGNFQGLSCIAAYEDEIYVGDPVQDRIQVFSTAGTYARKWGSSGTANGSFNQPEGISIYNGYVFVTDCANSRVQKFKGDGTYIGKFGANGSDAGEFSNPFGVVVEDCDTLYTTESDNDRVQALDPFGTYLRHYGSNGSGNYALDAPTDIDVADGRLYIADTGNSRVMVWDTDMVENLIVSYDPVENDYWFANQWNSFVLTPHGLGGPIDVSPTSLFRDDSENLVGAAVGMTNDAVEIGITTGIFDMNSRDSKHIPPVQMFASNVESPQLRVHYRYASNGCFKRSPWERMNPQQVGFPNVSFMDAKVEVKGNVSDHDGRIDQLDIRWQREGFRFQRGATAAPETR